MGCLMLCCSWTLFLLSTCPRAEAKVLAELDARGLLATATNPRPRDVSWDDLASVSALLLPICIAFIASVLHLCSKHAARIELAIETYYCSMTRSFPAFAVADEVLECCHQREPAHVPGARSRQLSLGLHWCGCYEPCI